MGLMDVPGRRRRLLGRTKPAKPAPETWVRCYALFLRFQGLMCLCFFPLAYCIKSGFVPPTVETDFTMNSELSKLGTGVTVLGMHILKASADPEMHKAVLGFVTWASVRRATSRPWLATHAGARVPFAQFAHVAVAVPTVLLTNTSSVYSGPWPFSGDTLDLALVNVTLDDVATMRGLLQSCADVPLALPALVAGLEERQMSPALLPRLQRWRRCTHYCLAQERCHDDVV